jgi:predicted dehydrogenase
MAPLRIGVLGAADIAPNAIIRPANAGTRAVVAAVAARDRTRALEFADRHGIPKVHDSYESLIDDVSLDAIYNPLPNGLHGHWTIAAVQAGKHVLCEKPFTANADEARAVASVADPTDRIVMEAFHWRYHPLATRVLEIIGDGSIGEVRSARASVSFPLFSPSDIRWQLDLAGGALMDAGCYSIHMLRHFVGGEPEVLSARAWERYPGVDRLAEARLRFPGDVAGEIRASMWSRHLLSVRVAIDGSKGRIRVMNPMAPQYLSWLRVHTASGSSFRERPPRSSTYLHQLDAFCDAVETRTKPITDTADAIANMAVIDAVYRAAGMDPREPTPVGPA